jgi:hypothetical protein
MRRILPSFPLVFFLLAACCSAQPLPQEKESDFKTQGFLDESHFQVIASAPADPSAKGLVAQRETAIVKARAGLQESAVKALVDFRMTRFNAENKGNQAILSRSAEVRAILSDEFKRYISYGAIAEEYYEMDNSATVVYRITKSGIRSDIETFQFKLRETEGGTK